MPTVPEAMAYFKKNGIILGPAKAANAGEISTQMYVLYLFI
jgi:glutamate dehydrogenase/leucine dehydrogenase